MSRDRWLGSDHAAAMLQGLGAGSSLRPSRFPASCSGVGHDPVCRHNHAISMVRTAVVQSGAYTGMGCEKNALISGAI